MSHPAIASKILDFCQSTFIDPLEDQLCQLTDHGELYAVSLQIRQGCGNLFGYIMENLLPVAADQIIKNTPAKERVNTAIRPLRITIANGASVEVNNYYDKRVDQSKPAQARHYLQNYWRLTGRYSPLTCDLVGFCSMVAPSFELAQQTLSKVAGIKMCTSSVNKITDRLASRCQSEGEALLAIKAGETLAGKRVVLSVDGGRSRIRDYTGKVNATGQPTFDTPWIEPKLFVIHVLDDEGELAEKELPLYGVRFTDEDCVELLGEYLKALNIKQAATVQLVADGAQWIWQRVVAKLKQLGVKDANLIQTVDYYHAISYVNSIVEALPNRISKKTRAAYLNDFKEALWQGDTDHIYLKCKELFKRPGKLVRRYINYFVKHSERMAYVDFKARKLVCGSGIVESAIRRIINLRFKNASTFWLPENLERLYFLRCSVLSGRWDTVMNNLFTR